MTSELAKTFDPASIEAKCTPLGGRGLFRPCPADRVPFTWLNPRPNVTGSLTSATHSTTRCRTS